jgi:3-hydroxyisobutyrate dehydrogenase
MTGVARIGFIGLGHMGGAMCGHLLAAGHEVSAFDIDPHALSALSGAGACAARSAADCADGAEVLITMLPAPPQVEEVLLGSGGALAALPDRAIVIEMSTSSRAVGERVRAAAAPRAIEVLDAPVAGQSIGARAGTLAIYVGGTRDAFERVLPLLEAMGDPARIFHTGGPGTGYAVKLLLNLSWFISSVATAEVLTVGVRAGIELERLYAALVGSPANTHFLERDVRSVLAHGDYDAAFPLRLVAKDLGLALDLAREVGVPVELSALVEQIHRRAAAAFGEEAGEMSAVRLYEERAGIRLRLPHPDP